MVGSRACRRRRCRPVDACRRPGTVVAPLLIGIDEGTTARQGRALRRAADARCARRAGASSRATRTPAGSSRTREEILDAVVDAVAELLARRARRGRRPAGSTTRASRCSRGTPRPASRSRRSSSGRTSARSRSSTRLAPDEDEITRAQRPAARPVLLVRQAHVAARERRRGAGGARRGTLRLGNVDAWLTDRLGAGFATDASTASRTQLHRLGDPGWDEWLCERFGVPVEALPDDRRQRRRARRRCATSAGRASCR